jgi:hypothetical protein
MRGFFIGRRRIVGAILLAIAVFMTAGLLTDAAANFLSVPVIQPSKIGRVSRVRAKRRAYQKSIPAAVVYWSVVVPVATLSVWMLLGPGPTKLPQEHDVGRPKHE